MSRLPSGYRNDFRREQIPTAGRVPVSTPAELSQILRDQKKGTPLLLQIRRGTSSLYAAIGEKR
jgi:hypothetical protein